VRTKRVANSPNRAPNCARWRIGENEERLSEINWLGREDSNLRMAESKSAALPLGYAPSRLHVLRSGGRTIPAQPVRINAAAAGAAACGPRVPSL
jgi:hypothetical protein